MSWLRGDPSQQNILWMTLSFVGPRTYQKRWCQPEQLLRSVMWLQWHLLLCIVQYLSLFAPPQGFVANVCVCWFYGLGLHIVIIIRTHFVHMLSENFQNILVHFSRQLLSFSVYILCLLGLWMCSLKNRCKHKPTLHHQQQMFFL